MNVWRYFGLVIVCIVGGGCTQLHTNIAPRVDAGIIEGDSTTPDAEVIDDEIEGLNTLYIGHSFGRVFAERLPSFAENVGIQNHTQRIVFSGGASGAPLALWQDDAHRREIQEILDGGDVDLMVMICCSEGWIETAEDPGILHWMDYALARNPDTRFALAMPWIDFPESYEDAATYEALWELGYAQWQQTANVLRSAYPGVEIFTIPHGRASGHLMALFEGGELPDVQHLRGATNVSIFVDEKGHAGQILKDMGGAIWLAAIYGVDVSNYAFERVYATDLGGLAQTIVSEDAYTRQP